MGFARILEAELRDRLQADPYFSDIPVFTTDNAVIGNEVARALGIIAGAGGKAGICVSIQPAARNATWQNVSGPFYNDVRVDVVVEEVPAINRSATVGTGKPFDDVSERVAALFGLTFVPLNCTSPMRPLSPTIDKPVLSAREGETQVGHISQTSHFQVSGTTSITINQVAKPIISVAAGVVTITCATPGAAIFYTINGAFPNPQTTLYTGTFSPGLVQVRCRAYLAGFLASDTNQFQLT